MDFSLPLPPLLRAFLPSFPSSFAGERNPPPQPSPCARRAPTAVRCRPLPPSCLLLVLFAGRRQPQNLELREPVEHPDPHRPHPRELRRAAIGQCLGGPAASRGRRRSPPPPPRERGPGAVGAPFSREPARFRNPSPRARAPSGGPWGEGPGLGGGGVRRRGTHQGEGALPRVRAHAFVPPPRAPRLPREVHPPVVPPAVWRSSHSQPH